MRQRQQQRPEPPQHQAVMNKSKMQRDLLARLREQSFIDPNVPLGPTSAAHPIEGPTVAQWFAAKARRGEQGRFYPLHLITMPHSEKRHTPHRLIAS